MYIELSNLLRLFNHTTKQPWSVLCTLYKCDAIRNLVQLRLFSKSLNLEAIYRTTYDATGKGREPPHQWPH
jgi:hypothetical protein